MSSFRLFNESFCGYRWSEKPKNNEKSERRTGDQPFERVPFLLQSKNYLETDVRLSIRKGKILPHGQKSILRERRRNKAIFLDGPKQGLNEIENLQGIHYALGAAYTDSGDSR